MNKVILLGRLTKDVDLRFAAETGLAVGRFTLAVNKIKKENGADFINCLAFGKTAEILSQYVFKGQQLAIHGRIQTRSYEDEAKIKRYVTEIIVEGFDFIATAKKNETTKDNSNNDCISDMQEVSDEEEIPF